MKIKNINLEMTSACNLRCAMCDIWKERRNNYFTIEMIDAIFSGSLLSKAADITLTGGEVFLHPDLFSLVERIHRFAPRGIRTVSTNGVLTKKIVAFMSRLHNILPKDFSMHISLDGINAHDAQRGVRSRRQVLKTLEYLKGEYPSMPIAIKFTITPINYFDILETYSFCRIKKLMFKPKIVEYAPHYTNRGSSRKFIFSSEQKAKIRKDLLMINKELRSRFISESIEYLYGTNKPRRCLAPIDRMFIMSTGDVYSCIHSGKIGNIHKAPLGTIWSSPAAQRQRERIERQGCRRCVSYHGGQ